MNKYEYKVIGYNDAKQFLLPRHYQSEDKTNGTRRIRSSKHRYIYLCTNDKKQKKQWLMQLRYKPQEYPKGDNSNYVLGDYIKEKLINKYEIKEKICEN